MNEWMKDLIECETEQCTPTWDILRQRVADYPRSDKIDPGWLGPRSWKVGTDFLQQQEAEKTWAFLNTDQLIAIASRVETAEKDVDQVPGIYIFCSLVGGGVLKVGETKHLRIRICQHLRNPTMNTDSLLIDYANRRWSVPEGADWHHALNTNEVTALVFMFYQSKKSERLQIERSLQARLDPAMR